MLFLFDRVKNTKEKRFLGLKAQTSLEFVFTITLSLMLLIPSTILFDRYVSDSQDALVNTQVYKIGSELIHLSEKLYATGVAWETIEVSLPGAVQSVEVYNDTDMSELVITYESDRLSEVVFFTPIRLYNDTWSDCTEGCEIPILPGESELRIESYRGGTVVINSRN